MHSELIHTQPLSCITLIKAHGQRVKLLPPKNPNQCPSTTSIFGPADIFVIAEYFTDYTHFDTHKKGNNKKKSHKGLCSFTSSTSLPGHRGAGHRSGHDGEVCHRHCLRPHLPVHLRALPHHHPVSNSCLCWDTSCCRSKQGDSRCFFSYYFPTRLNVQCFFLKKKQ